MAVSADDDLIQLFQRVDNAGRWGADDELGTLNFITPEKRRRASLLVREGRVLSLALPIPRSNPSRAPRIVHRMLGVAGAADDELTFAVHQQNFSHLDCVSHIGSYHGYSYNRRPYGDAVTMDGVTFGSVRAQSGGIFTRGVLLDLPVARGTLALAAHAEITPADLEAAEAHAGVTVGSGDVIVVRTGAQTEHQTTVLRPGPGAACIEWIHDRQVAVYTGDSPERLTVTGAKAMGLLDDAEAEPRSARQGTTRLDGEDAKSRFPLPFHQIAIPAMGLSLLDFCAVEELARTCVELGRYEFLFVVAPLPIEGGTGSPVNPLAVF